MDEEVKNYNFRLSFSLNRKKALIIGLIVVFLALIFTLYKVGSFRKAYIFAMRADTSISVVDEKTSAGVPALVTLKNIKKESYQGTAQATDNGEAKIERLVPGSYNLEVTREGYKKVAQQVVLKRGKSNKFEIKISPIPPKQVTISGTVKGYFSDSGMTGITVAVGDKATITDSDGQFSIPELNLGTYELKISKKGYLPLVKSVEATEVDVKVDQILLVPEGRIVFVSNRESGKRGVYTANYDGSEQKKLIERVGDSEDFSPIISPDYKKVAFTSTRDGEKENGQLKSKLYVVDINGKNLTKVTDNNIEFYRGYYWTKDAKKLIWSSSSDNKMSVSIYDIAGKTNQQVDQDKWIGSYIINDESNKIVYTAKTSSSGQNSIYVWDIGTSAVINTVLENTNAYPLRFAKNEVVYSLYQDNKTKYFSYNLNGSSSEIEYENPKRDYVVSKDNTKKAFIESRDGKNNVFVVDTNDKNEKQLTSIDTAQWPLYFSEDYSLLLFNSFKTGESALYAVSSSGGPARKVVDISDNNREGPGY